MSKDHGYYTQELEHDSDYRVKRVSNYKSDGSGGLVRDLTGDLAVVVATDTSYADVKYVGRGAIGAATSGAVWQVKRLDTRTIDVQVEWADGDSEFDNVWDNRESLSYS